MIQAIDLKLLKALTGIRQTANDRTFALGVVVAIVPRIAIAKLTFFIDNIVTAHAT